MIFRKGQRDFGTEKRSDPFINEELQYVLSWSSEGVGPRPPVVYSMCSLRAATTLGVRASTLAILK